MTPEIQRLIRHGIVPLVIIAVQAGGLPVAAQSDVIEFSVMSLSIAGPFVWSWLRDRSK